MLYEFCIVRFTMTGTHRPTFEEAAELRRSLDNWKNAMNKFAKSFGASIDFQEFEVG